MNDRYEDATDRHPARRRWPLVLGSAGAALVLWQFVSPIAIGARTRTATATDGRADTPRGPLGSDEQATINLFRAAAPSVVFITTLELRQDMWSRRVYEQARGSGSGFVWDTAGHIVTNYHVIDGANRATVTLADGSSWPAKVVGAERDKDLAVLLIEAPREVLPALPIGTSADLAVGQKVLAIGNPFGLDQTLTTGIISALGREITSVSQRPIQDVIQTDAAINPGNSGGPLLDSSGRLVGVSTAIYSPSGAYAGIGFAVPVDTVNRIVPQLIRYGKVSRPGLGIEVFSDDFLRRQAQQVPAFRDGGVLIREVIRGTSADDAGLRGATQDFRGRVRWGDLVVAIDGGPVRDFNDLFRLLDGRAVGDTVVLTVLRDGAKRRVEPTLQQVN